jgi:hypothetical protein
VQRGNKNAARGVLKSKCEAEDPALEGAFVCVMQIALLLEGVLAAPVHSVAHFVHDVREEHAPEKMEAARCLKANAVGAVGAHLGDCARRKFGAAQLGVEHVTQRDRAGGGRLTHLHLYALHIRLLRGVVDERHAVAGDEVVLNSLS